MPPIIASVVWTVGILGLLWLDRDKESRTSSALWIPVVWLWIVGSRPVSVWLQIAPPQSASDQYIEGSPLDRLVFAVLIVAGLVVLACRGGRVARLLRANWPIVLFFIYCATSTIWSDFPGVAFRRWVKSLGDLVLILVVLTDGEPLAAVKRVLSRVGFVLLPVSVLLIKYYPSLGRTYSPGIGFWSQMYTGVATSKNSLGGLGLIFGLGALWQFLGLFQNKDVLHRRRRLIAQGTLLAFAIEILWQTNSLTSSACFAIGSIIILTIMLFRFGKQPGVVHLLVAGLVSLSLFGLFLDPASGLIESLGRSSTLTGRTQIWSQVLSMPVSRLFGTGFESFWLGPRLQTIWSLYWWHPNEAHNGYIEVLLNLGWIGVSLLALLLITGYRRIFATLRRDPNVASLELAYFLVAVVYSFTEAGFRMLGLTWIFFLLAIAASKALVPEPEREVVADPWEKLGKRAIESRPHALGRPRVESF